jgi:hypothetical protein
MNPIDQLFVRLHADRVKAFVGHRILPLAAWHNAASDQTHVYYFAGSTILVWAMFAPQVDQPVKRASPVSMQTTLPSWVPT